MSIPLLTPFPRGWYGVGKNLARMPRGQGAKMPVSPSVACLRVRFDREASLALM